MTYTETGSGGGIGSSAVLTIADLISEDGDYFITYEDGSYIVLGSGLVSGDNTLLIRPGSAAIQCSTIISSAGEIVHGSTFTEVGSGGAYGGGNGFSRFIQSHVHKIRNICKLRNKKLFVKCRGGWVPVLTRCNQVITDPNIAVICPRGDYRKTNRG